MKKKWRCTCKQTLSRCNKWNTLSCSCMRAVKCSHVPAVCVSCCADRFPYVGVYVYEVLFTLPVCVCLWVWMHECPVSQSASHWDGCTQRRGSGHAAFVVSCCIMLLAGRLFKQSPVSHSGCPAMITHDTHTHRLVQYTHKHTLCNSKECSHRTARQGGGARGCQRVCLSTWKWFVLRNTTLSRPVVMEDAVMSEERLM